MKFPDDIFPSKFEYDMYVGSYRVRVFLADSTTLPREMLVSCLLRQIDVANEELARLRNAEVFD